MHRSLLYPDIEVLNHFVFFDGSGLDRLMVEQDLIKIENLPTTYAASEYFNAYIRTIFSYPLDPVMSTKTKFDNIDNSDAHLVRKRMLTHGVAGLDSTTK